MIYPANGNVDKVKLALSYGDYRYIKKVFAFDPHIQKEWKWGKVKLTIGGKAVAEPDSFKAIAFDNISKLIAQIERQGIIITEDTILNAPLEWIDVKKDVFNNTGLPNEYLISALKELAIKKTSKMEIISGFDKEKGFETSLTLKSTCKTIYDSLAIYPKVKEIKTNKCNDPDYFDNFSPEYLAKNFNRIRFERRLQSSKDIKKAYHLEHLEYVTLKDIFESSMDAVSDKVKELFL